MAVAELDASLFLHGSESERKDFAEQMIQSCKQWGFVKIFNHGIAESTISELFHWVFAPELLIDSIGADFDQNKTRKFFQLPLSEKQKIAHPPGPDPQRGWSCVGAERTAKLYGSRVAGASVNEDLYDAREHFDQGSTSDTKWPNRWPSDEDLPGFRTFMENHYDTCRTLSFHLLEAFEIGLKLPSASLTSKITQNAHELRLNNYPAIDIKELRSGSVNRISPHTDLGVITCLFQDSSGGLEIEDRSNPGTFVPLSSNSPSEMIVNISETFQRWTNDQLPAGLHQVTIPPNLKHLQQGEVPTRYSSACFVKADRDALVGPLSQFVSSETPALHDYITALDYHQRRVASAYRT